VSNPKRRIPWYLWPFYAIWRLVTLILDATGRLLCGVLGLVLMVVGTMLSLTVVGAVLGVPLILVGVLLVVRALF
jgi:hypothetical protein